MPSAAASYERTALKCACVDRLGQFGRKKLQLAISGVIILGGDAVHSGELAKAEYETFGTFDLQIPATALDGVPRELLIPRLAWKDKEVFEREGRKFGGMFTSFGGMFTKVSALYERDADEKVRTAGSSSIGR
ncbi:hypothetical protein PHLGIDRAFT_121549 [Phlebiopsis gigantea 11061_1 CR5-6]|uniref:Uncharacterized protein n=1 Tax=Phlebiopsis gigantea (strain 11061_1 CR5-6) TaxID=745531 RepID=A0A0C3NFI6_PHLG1|nr:hypothetical protein PHLGIDRAFT_121549 [Phlebiopsis gigantea 11061_1 CR5-6]